MAEGPMRSLATSMSLRRSVPGPDYDGLATCFTEFGAVFPATSAVN